LRPSRNSAASSTDQVVIAIDPHKASWTAVAADVRLRHLAAARPVTPDPVSYAGAVLLVETVRRPGVDR
jgi:hypothetical protein